MISEYIFLNSFLKKQIFFTGILKDQRNSVEKNKYEHTKELPEIITDEELE